MGNVFNEEEELNFLKNYLKVYENENWKPILKQVVHKKNFEPIVVSLLVHKDDLEKDEHLQRHLVAFTKQDKSMAFDPDTFWILSVIGRLFAKKFVDPKILDGK